MDAKLGKKQTVKSILECFNKDGYITFFQKEIESDTERIARYKDLQRNLTAECVEEQGKYTNYEKGFFQTLEQSVVKKKLDHHIVNLTKKVS